MLPTQEFDSVHLSQYHWQFFVFESPSPFEELIDSSLLKKIDGQSISSFLVLYSYVWRDNQILNSCHFGLKTWDMVWKLEIWVDWEKYIKMFKTWQ